MLLAGCAPMRRTAQVAPPDPGKLRFDSYCAACHLSGGAAGIGEAPPLDGTPWVKGPAERLIRIVLHGLRGPIEIYGTTYNKEMPAFGESIADADMAALLSYVRRRFAGIATPVSPETVAQVRAATRGRTTYWTVEELLAEPLRPSPNSWPISTTLPLRK